MEDWAKAVTEDGEVIYINRITGKFIQEVDPLPIVNWGGIQIGEKRLR